MQKCHNSDMIHHDKKSAFTLAEVLITLGIIGVIAAITIPTLVTNYQKKVTVNRLKKNYATISQMFTKAINDYGDPSGWSFDFGEMGEGNSNINAVLPIVAKKYFLPYLDVMDDCGISCAKVPNTYRYMNNALVNQFHTRLFYTMFLKDESIIFLSVNSNGNTGLLSDLIIYVDLNGLKAPNVIGKDVFGYYLNTSGVSKLNFWGLTNQNVSRDVLLNDSISGCNKNAWGRLCGALIERDGWKISDDYPW